MGKAVLFSLSRLTNSCHWLATPTDWPQRRCRQVPSQLPRGRLSCRSAALARVCGHCTHVGVHVCESSSFAYFAWAQWSVGNTGRRQVMQHVGDADRGVLLCAPATSTGAGMYRPGGVASCLEHRRWSWLGCCLGISQRRACVKLVCVCRRDCGGLVGAQEGVSLCRTGCCCSLGFVCWSRMCRSVRAVHCLALTCARWLVCGTTLFHRHAWSCALVPGFFAFVLPASISLLTISIRYRLLTTLSQGTYLNDKRLSIRKTPTHHSTVNKGYLYAVCKQVRAGAGPPAAGMLWQAPAGWCHRQDLRLSHGPEDTS